MKLIPSMAVAALLLCCPLMQARAEFSAEDSLWMTQTCKVLDADVKVIDKLESQVQADLTQLVQRRDCKSLDSFKNSRDYMRKMKAANKISKPSPSGWNLDYITNEELSLYIRLSSQPPVWRA